MASSWLMNWASLAKGRIRRSQKTITYTYTVDTSRRPRRCSSRSQLSPSSAGTTSSREGSSGSDSARLPNEIRPGYMMVFVGSQRKRFIISSSILNHPFFKLLLERHESNMNAIDHPIYQDYEETGGILLSCEVEFLHRLLFLIDSGGDANQEMRWDELKKVLEGNS